jgi:ABC-type nitrate/sulfonate/bicarbonate transport system substrate-binding protein
MRPRKTGKTVVFLVSTFLVLLFLVSRLWALVDFPIGYASLGGTYAFIELIQNQKLLEKEGIQPKFIYIGGPQISHALVSGDIQMAIVAAASPILAAGQGAEIRIVAGVTDREIGAIVAQPNILKPADLKGTRMAIDRLGDYTDFRARKVLGLLGLEPQKDVILLPIGGQTARFAALKSGNVQSVFVAPPLTLVAKRAGFHVIVELADLGFPSTSGALVVLQSTAAKRGKEVYGVIRAVAESLRIYKTNKDLAMQALAQFMKVKDREAIEEAWESHRKIYQDVPVPPVDGIMMVKAFLGQTNPKVAKLTERDLIDMRFVNQLKK